MKLKTKEKQYSHLGSKKYKPKFGLMSGATWVDDPRRLLFLLARYKFVSKLVNCNDIVLEVGCADAFGSRLVAKECSQIFCTDFDQIFINNAKKINKDIKNMTFYLNNFVKCPASLPKKPSLCFCLDVLEHISPKMEKKFIHNLKSSCQQGALFVFGSPSYESQKYASKPSKIGHINCKTGKIMKQSMQRFFKRVLLFSMNDEVLHTGFEPMAHYRLAICY